MRALLTAIYILLGLVTLGQPADAGRRKAAAMPRPTPVKIVVIGVTANSVTISDELGPGRTLNVTPFTEIRVNGQKATLADVKTGMVVDVALRDPTTASRITAAASK